MLCYDADDIAGGEFYAACPDCGALCSVEQMVVEHRQMSFDRIGGLGVEDYEISGCRGLIGCDCGAGFDVFMGRADE